MRSKRFLIGACVLAARVAVPASAFGAAAATQTIEAEVGGKDEAEARQEEVQGDHDLRRDDHRGRGEPGGDAAEGEPCGDQLRQEAT